MAYSEAPTRLHIIRVLYTIRSLLRTVALLGTVDDFHTLAFLVADFCDCLQRSAGDGLRRMGVTWSLLRTVITNYLLTHAALLDDSTSNLPDPSTMTDMYDVNGGSVIPHP